MDRFKEFLRTKGLYIAIGAGVLAFVGLMVIYNYNTYKSEFGLDKQTVDLNSPEITEATGQVADTKVEMPEATEANSDEAVAGNTDAEDKSAQMTGNQDAEDESAQKTGNPGAEDESAQMTGNPGAEDESAQMTGNQSAKNAQSTDAGKDVTQTADGISDTEETSSDGVIVDKDGVIVANAYNEGGALVWPVEGEVILPFSMDTTVYFKTLRSYRCNPGILIAAEEGENVLAAYEGVVESVSEDKEHGTTVTVIMGNGYKAIYGQLMNVTVAEGDTITTAQNIGEAAAPSSYYTEEGTHVFFELMKNGVPINPIILMQ